MAYNGSMQIIEQADVFRLSTQNLQSFMGNEADKCSTNWKGILMTHWYGNCHEKNPLWDKFSPPSLMFTLGQIPPVLHVPDTLFGNPQICDKFQRNGAGEVEYSDHKIRNHRQFFGDTLYKVNYKDK